MITIIVFIIVLGVLVFVHEMGHFLIAIRNGIKADEFGFGFPPRIFGFWKNPKTGKTKFVWGNKDIKSKNTVYSVNWIPLGGFVKIKGEGGEEKKSPDSFASKPAWVRVKVLAAGVIMNFVLGWFLLSIVFFIGMPEAIDDSEVVSNSKVQISGVIAGTPAEEMGIKVGDEILGGCGMSTHKCQVFRYVSDVQEFTKANQGQEIALKVKRGNQDINTKGFIRDDYPEDQGPLGVSLARTAIKKYSFIESVWQGLLATVMLGFMVFKAFVILIKGIVFGSRVGMDDVAGPVGIAVLTKQVTELGMAYLLRFAAVLSINLGIINALPIPALDGGRILFIMIEKIKGSPISQKFENFSHTVGFFLLIGIMIVVTLRDFMRFDIFGKIIGIF
ncbi:MAG: site-2 protease family protein [Candidatus Moranbacteria bacterium]|nr:site-2 protease family protein [Candidatus Moranbacteria bacterium]